MLYRRGEEYSEKNNCLIYLFSTNIRYLRIYTKRNSTISNKQLTRKLTNRRGSNAVLPNEVRSIRILTNSLNKVICHVPHQTGEYGTMPFLRWVQAQDGSPHKSGILKKATGPVCFLFKRDTSGGRK